MKDKFTRTDIQAILTRSGLETAQARKLTAGIVETMASALAAGETVELRGLGTLESRERKARTLRNPRTMAPVNIPACMRIVFRPGKELKAALKKR